MWSFNLHDVVRICMLVTDFFFVKKKVCTVITAMKLVINSFLFDLFLPEKYLHKHIFPYANTQTSCALR